MVAVFGFFLEGVEADGFEGGGDVFFGDHFTGLGEGLVEKTLGNVADGFARKHLLVRKNFEEDVAKAEDIHASINVGIAAREFRRHVKRCAIAAAHGGEGGIFVGAHFGGGQLGFAPDFGEAPVDDQCFTKTAD